MVPFIRSPYNYDMSEASDESGLSCPPDEGLTQQQFADEVDINTIVRRFGLTGELPENVRVPVSGDFTGISDFKSAMDAVMAAQADFLALPATVRARFDNDPQQLLEFMDNDANREEAVKLGLVNAAPVVVPPVGDVK